MATPTTLVAASSHRRRRRRGSTPVPAQAPAPEGVPGWILLNSGAHIGSRSNATTAVGEARDKLTIEVSLWPAQPPHPSDVFVCCPGVRRPRESEILFTAQDLLLMRVPVAAGAAPSLISFTECDYLIYRAAAGDRRPSLTLLPNPKPNYFHDGDVGILPRGGGEYTVAALVARPREREYMIHRFDSDDAGGRWTTKTVWMDDPRRPPPVEIPINARRLNHHITTTTITLGGELAGAMGWVDLWTGILIYDLLHDDKDQDRPTLRHMPLPLPMHAITGNHGMGDKLALGCPRSLRGIASVTRRGKACLKLAGVHVTGERLPYNDAETQLPAFAVDDWTVTTWSNDKMKGYFEDWQEDFTIRGSEVRISNAMRSDLLRSGLLYRKSSRGDGDEATVEELALHNLWVSHPTPSLDGEEDVIYLLAKPKCFHPKAWVLALDTRSSTLLGVVEFGTEIAPSAGVTCRPSTISKYMSLVTSPVTGRT
ncbi:uncharacterized protein LOC127757965 [Oryza glaberrima]|uniref:uncharacterized protein LOC127757965 n=1 Tax=Oryza glaberrima TaxID=4538 RepID=UPI00023DF37A|nr:uncharacterized protein LOC127757965 [Oryza glaberrima]